MILQTHTSLKPYNTFGLDVNGHHFCQVSNLNEFKQAISESKEKQHLIIGGGSNIVLTKDYEGIVILNKIEGIQLVEETESYVKIKANSGENWHQFVLYCIENNWGGIENLSLIPGTIGAAPMQNIGAYGVEIVNVFDSLEALNLETLELETFSKLQCEFGYRESVFKRKLKGQYFIYSVTFILTKNHQLNIDYGDIQTTLQAHNVDPEKANIQQVSNAVIEIRQSKLPNPAVLGNSGSFFKNPTISTAHFQQLKIDFPEIKGYEQPNGVKVPAGWLIEQCGWKGKRVGETGSHVKQALVLVNYGNATGNEVHALALDIIKSVKEKYGISLEPEVNII